MSTFSQSSDSKPPNADALVFWQQRYQTQQTPWNLGEPAPPFLDLLNPPQERSPASLPPGKLLVVGAGHGHDAALFAQHGFEVTGIDFAPEAVMAAREQYGHLARFQEANLFHLPTEWRETWDYLLEHTCFCAILPKRRGEYVQAVTQMLKPQGLFIGLFWAHSDWGGPPYKTDEEEIHRLFSPHFHILSLTIPDHSTPSRAGEERLGVFQKR